MPSSKGSRSANRILEILEVFEKERRPLTLGELADRCEIPASTCHALVHTLLSRAYLYQTGRRKYLYPTRRILDIAATIAAHDPFLERIGPVLEELRLVTRETVILAKRQGDLILYLDVFESPQTIRYSSRAGEYKPLHSTSIGKVMLGALSDAELAMWFRQHPLSRVTGNTITTRAKLVASLEEGRRLGYFISRGENVADVTAIAVPALVGGELLGIAVAGPSHRMKSDRRKHAARLLEAQRKLHRAEVTAR